MRMDITTIGEVLIDLTQNGTDARGVGVYSANPGGAPANVAVAAARLGAKTAFIGKVGRDSFGRTLRHTLEENRVDVQGLLEDESVHTTLAVVSVDAHGERSFAFYRAPGADLMLSQSEVRDALLSETRFLHFGSVSLTADPAREATLYAARRAKELGALISYDPNFRPALWPDEATAIRWMRVPLGMVDVLKVSEEELVLMSDTDVLEDGAQALAEKGIRLVLVTLGAKGVYYRWGDLTGTIPGFAVQVADTNGAGDTFFGAVLSKLARRGGGLDSLTRQELEDILRFANRAASLTTSRSGAIPAMPTLAEVESCLAGGAETAH
jgi:fructokinase